MKRLPRQGSSIAWTRLCRQRKYCTDSEVVIGTMPALHSVGADKHWTPRVRARKLVVLALAALSVPSVFTFSVNPHLFGMHSAANMKRGASDSKYDRTVTLLHAQPGGRNSGSSTARDSAVLAEWEPVSELQRRIDEGRRYEHWVEYDGPAGPGRQKRVHNAKANPGSSITLKGVFCGYRVTKEEYSRLKSADPDEPESDYSI
jgi:hypothetical protein